MFCGKNGRDELDRYGSYGRFYGLVRGVQGKAGKVRSRRNSFQPRERRIEAYE